MEEPKRRIRAVYTASTVTVYQAYTPEIGLPAARYGRFPTAWKRDRMTWVKPSFLWMMYRCGWGTKEGQETVLVPHQATFALLTTARRRRSSAWWFRQMM
ncbi:DUF4291 family protein [Streptosporangium amethystogenes subsp. fukuiense]|uniref:DUF4291 family protein n=1 Tax=Streptosporangium amethystogenes subsp. fukuiense TaxID=698418 RepID=A0ABW2T6I3_9ACTN